MVPCTHRLRCVVDLALWACVRAWIYVWMCFVSGGGGLARCMLGLVTVLQVYCVHACVRACVHVSVCLLISCRWGTGDRVYVLFAVASLLLLQLGQQIQKTPLHTAQKSDLSDFICSPDNGHVDAITGHVCYQDSASS